MKLEFDSISEMEQFLMFSAHIGRAFAVAPASSSAVATAVQETVTHNGTSSEPGVNLSSGDQAGNEAGAEVVAATNDAPVSTDKPKRTRRTKAEMIAADLAAEDRAAAENDPLTPGVAVPNVPAAGQTATSVEPSASVSPSSSDTATGSSPTGANPFAVASPATQAILEAPNQSAATLAGIAAMQTPPIDEPGKTEAEQPRVIESIEHLRACQSFIQAHGMARYNESFKDGLNANIAAYTPEQRAQHVAILSTLGV